MKIEHCIYTIVIMLVMMSCGSSSKSVKRQSKVERQELKMTRMSGIGVVHGDARMSEGVSVTETEVHYSLPDSSGRQHIVKTVIRASEIDRNTNVLIEMEDSMEVTKDIRSAEKEDTEVKEEKKSSNIHLILFVSVGFIVIAMAAIKVSN